MILEKVYQVKCNWQDDVTYGEKVKSSFLGNIVVYPSRWFEGVVKTETGEKNLLYGYYTMDGKFFRAQHFYEKEIESYRLYNSHDFVGISENKNGNTKGLITNNFAKYNNSGLGVPKLVAGSFTASVSPVQKKHPTHIMCEVQEMLRDFPIMLSGKPKYELIKNNHEYNEPEDREDYFLNNKPGISFDFVNMDHRMFKKYMRREHHINLSNPVTQIKQTLTQLIKTK